MSALGLLFLVTTVGLLFALPRRWAPLPLLIAAACVPRSQLIHIGAANLSLIRQLIFVGFLRAIVKGERIVGGFNLLDRLMVLLAVWMICSGVFHGLGLAMWRFGDAYTYLGCYFLFRIFLREPDDILRVVKMVCIVLLPIAVGMILEKMTGKNFIASLFGEAVEARLRDGHYRASGPYANAILAGTVGAIWLPLMLHMWRRERKVALAGLAAVSAMIFASGASGPILTAFAGLGAMAFWRFRRRLRALCWLAPVLIIALDLVMKDPVYFLIARVNIIGGSTGWYRAILIQGAIEHLNEWWLAGTDATSHWVPEGTSGVVGQADLANQYIGMGVAGGLLLVFIFVGVLIAAFAAVGKALQRSQDAPLNEQLFIWALGATLFAHAVTFWSVAYFEPSTILFFYLALAATGALHSTTPVSAPVGPSNELGSDDIPQPAVSHG